MASSGPASGSTARSADPGSAARSFDRPQGRPVALGHQPALEPLAPVGVDHQDEHALGALHRVGHLEVDDAHVEVGGQREDRARARPRGRGWSGAARPGPRAGPPAPAGSTRARRAWSSTPSSRSRSPSATIARTSASASISSSSSATMAVAVLGADVGPDARVAGGDAGHVPEPAGRQAQHGPVLLGPLVGQAHHGGRGQVRARATPWPPASRGGRAGWPPPTPRSDDTIERMAVKAASSVPGTGVSTQVAPSNRSARAPSTPSSSEPGHRVAADVAGVVHQVEHRRLHAADVGDQAGAGGQRLAHLVGHRADGRGHEGDLGVGVVADGVERAQLEGPARAIVGSRSRPVTCQPWRPQGLGRSSRRSGRCPRSGRGGAGVATSAQLGRSSRRSAAPSR